MADICAVDNEKFHATVTGKVKLGDGSIICGKHFKKEFNKLMDPANVAPLLDLDTFKLILSGEMTSQQFRNAHSPRGDKKGFVKQQQIATAANIYNHQVKKNVHEKDGFVHVMMINSFSKWINQNFGVEDKYTTQLDQIVTGLQSDGYEIVDIKFNSLQNQGLSGQQEGFNTLIMYR